MVALILQGVCSCGLPKSSFITNYVIEVEAVRDVGGKSCIVGVTGHGK